MKFFIFLFSSFIAVNALTAKNLFAEEWKLYKAEYEKYYDSLEEDENRMKVFLENKKFIAQHNVRYIKGEETYEMGINKFTDWFPEEIDNLNGFNRENRLLYGENAPLPVLDAEIFVPPENATYSEEVDWVKKGAVTSIKDQGRCGSCYAFSAVGSLEGQMYLKKKISESLSVQNIVDCSRKHGNQGCNGGFAHFSFNYIRDNRGINSEKVYPYEAKYSQCRYNPSNVAATCTGHVQVEQNERRLKEAVATVGPIAVNLDTRSKSFINYKGGIYSDAKCDPNVLVHAVLLVGYGVDPTTKKEYWLLKNSWGTTWGLRGYFKLARNANNMCGVASLATYPKV